MLYNITIYPIEIIYKFLYLAISKPIGSYGISLIILSIVTTILILPFMKWANSMQASEKHLQDIMKPQLDKIKEESTGSEQHTRITKLYNRYSYHPAMAIRSAAGVALQVPFLMGAYYMLSSLPDIQRQSFLFINDLSKPDGLLWGVNLLPILMTAINILSAITTETFAKKDKIQASIIAFLFLILLYKAPSALLIFWTCNNLWVLLKNFYPNVCIVNLFPQIFLKQRCDIFFIALFLISYTPLIFTLSLNYFMYTPTQILVSTLFIFIFSLCIYFPYFAINKLFKNGLVVKLSKICSLIGAVLWIILLMNSTIRPLLPTSAYMFRILFYCAVLIFFPILLSFLDSKKIIYFCAIWFVICIGNSLLSNATSDQVIKQSDTNYESDVRPIAKFKFTPNLYLLEVESLPRVDNIYSLDMSKLETFLTHHNFKIANHAYSNYAPTANSLLALFNQKHHYYKYQKGFAELTTEGKALLSTSKAYVYKTFIDNGYTIHSISSNGIISTMGNDGLFHSLQPSAKQSLLEPILNLQFRLRAYFDPQNANIGRVATLEDKIKFSNSITTQIERLVADKNIPRFTFISYDFLHEDFRMGDTCESKRDSWLEEYKESYKQQEKLLIDNISYILRNDPYGVILLLGDHGSRHYAVCRCAPELANTDSFLKTHNLDYKWITEDMFSTMIALHVPTNTMAEKIDINESSHVNIFMYIFYNLSRNKQLLNYAEKSNSYALIDRSEVYQAKNGKLLLIPWRPLKNIKY